MFEREHEPLLNEGKMATAETASAISLEEYLELERRSEIRHEYLAGRIYAMPGASRSHNRIVVNLVRELSTRLRGGPCEVFASDMRIRVSPTGLYTYPDIAVVCAEPRFDSERRDTLLNPGLIIEVLSDSTEAYDRGEKFAHFRRLESLVEYVLVAQDRVRVERFTRRGDDWLLTEVSGPEAVLALESIGCEVRSSDIYERVQFEETSTRARTLPAL